MDILVAGGHGKVALRLLGLLAGQGHTARGLIRSPGQAADLTALGAVPVIGDLENDETLNAYVQGADAVVFAAGAGPGSGAARKDTVDRAAAVLLADAAERAGVRRYVLVSSMGVESVADGARPEGLDDVFVVYLQAKLAAERDVLARSALRTTVLRPGSLTDDPGTGLVALDRSADQGRVPRDDVAAVLVGLIDADLDGAVLELVGGATPVAEAVANVTVRPAGRG